MALGSDDAVAAHELDLVQRAAQGDGAAFDQFFERHGAHVQVLVERLLGPGEVADGVVVEAFEKTVRRLPLLGARNSSPGLYVLTTARNGAYAALGRARPTADGGALAALLALPSRQRELLALREIGLSSEQAGEVAGIAAGEVGPQVARARLRLIDALESTTLTAVVADAADEALLGALAMRAPGTDDPQLEAKVAARGEADPRFAEAATAVRSPARSVGQLPAASGAARLAATAAGAAVGASMTAATAVPATPPPAQPTPEATAEPANAGSGSEGPGAAADPFDDMIGDEAAWGIVDDDLDSSAGGADVSDAPAAPKAPAGRAAAAGGAAAAGAAAAGAGSADDPLVGWDDLDWPDDGEEATVVAASAPVSGADGGGDGDGAAAAIPPMEPTRAFDVVGAGLADADEPADDAEGEQPRGSRWRILGWILALALVFAGVAFAVYTVATAARDDAPSTTPLTDTPAETTGEDAPSDTDEPASTSQQRDRESSSGSSSSSRDSGSSSSSGGSSSGGSSSAGSGGSSSSSSSGGGGSSSSSSSGGSSGGSSGSSGGGSGGGSSGEDRTVSGGGTESGGSVRGEGGTTP